MKNNAQVVFNAGGLGTRLWPLTYYITKAMVPVLGKPFVQYQMEVLKKQGFNRFLMCTGYRHNQIRDFFGNGNRFGVSIQYSEESESLGTAGSLKNAENLLDDEFLLISADIFMNIDFSLLIKNHNTNNPIATMALIQKQDPSQWGVVLMNGKSQIIRFVEKPTEFIGNMTNTSIVFLNKGIMNYIPSGKFFSLERDVYPKLVNEQKINGFVVNDAYHIDIGVPERHSQFNNDVLAGKVIYDMTEIGKS